MTDPNYTHLAILVDRSGSMSAIASAAEEALRSMLTEQIALPGKLTVTLAQFDTEYEVVLDRVDGLDVSDALDWSLQPRGMTALHDAMGKLIFVTGAELANLPEEERPGKVIVVIVTDGLENSSREWSGPAVKELVERQTEKFAWQFLYIGANQDAVAVGSALGVTNNMTYKGSKRGVAAAYATASASVSAFRGGGAATTVLPEQAE